MKKFLIFSVFLTVLPSFAVCPIDSGETMCSLPNFREQVSPIFQDRTPGNINTPRVQLQPMNRADPIDQMRQPNNNLNYNSGCQFGVCLQNPKESRLPEKAK